MLIRNNSYITKYLDIRTGVYIEPTQKTWVNKEITDKSLDAHISNSYAMSQRPGSYNFVLDNILPIPPRSSWKIEGDTIQELKQPRLNTNHKYDLDDLLNFCKKLMNQNSHKIGIELSGGLDTAIIIGIAKELGLNYSLIGAISERYEFRTERMIQELIANDHQDVNLIPEIETLPFSELPSSPFHPIPNKSSLFYYLNKVTAEWAKEKKIKYVLNGIGFDTILVDEVNHKSSNYYFDKSNLEDSWTNDFTFAPRSCSYVNIASIYGFRKIILSMRILEKVDNKKLWARNTFREFLPRELSKYEYKASFGANYADGLKRNEEEIFVKKHQNIQKLRD